MSGEVSRQPATGKPPLTANDFKRMVMGDTSLSPFGNGGIPE